LEPLERRQLLSAAVPNIMPLGDSITEASTGHASYRYWLWKSLADAGYTVNFVGSEAGVADGPALYPGFDQDHEGHSGWRADDIQDKLESGDWKSFASLPQNTPDIVLLHIGSNDVEEGRSDTSTRDEISNIIDDLRAVNPNVTILLAKLIPETDTPMSGLNDLLPGLVSQKDTDDSRVILVDQSSGFDPVSDTYDGIHPDESGEKKMAAKWLTAMTPFLPAPTAPPDGTYLDTPTVPLTNADNAVGPAEYETSNGDDSGGDGQMLSLRGEKFMRGFGVHANSELDFDLTGGSYTRFRATVGVDDEVEGNGSVVFQVFVDNESTPRFSSQTLTGEDAALPIDVDISGAKSLRLVVTDAGNDNDFDHGDWAQARLIGTGDTTTPPPPDPGDPTEPPVVPPPIKHRPAVPSAPRSLRGKVHGQRVDLTWRDTSNNETGFRIVRRLPKGIWRTIATLGPDMHSFRDKKVAAGARYYYRVVAFNSAGLSKASNLAQERIPRATKAKKVQSIEPAGRSDKKSSADLTKPVASVWNLIEPIR